MSTTPSPNVFAPVRALIQAQLLETGLASLAVAVARDGEILWEEGFGWANREERLPATPHTLYSLASISKPITATGLMVLRERGLLDLDRPANAYVGDATLTARVGNADEATLRRVASHAAGLPLHHQFFYADEPRRRPPMDETIRRYGNLVTPPGTSYQYSNLGYGVLDHIMARASGLAYADFMRQEVFIPLNMPHASVQVGSGLEAHVARRYTPAGRPLPAYDFDHPGGSAVFGSVHDLVRFGLFHLRAHLSDQKAILSDATIGEMQTPVIEMGPGAGYGLGWAIVADEHGYRTVSHDGEMGGVSTRLRLVPEEKIVVAVLTNGQGSLHARIVGEILATLLPDYAARRAQREAGEKEKVVPAPVGFGPPPELLGTWQGSVHTYQTERPLTLTFQPDGDIHARLDAQLTTLVNEASFQDGRLSGVFAGDLCTEDTVGHTWLRVNLSLRGGALQGVLTAQWPGPADRMRNALSHWTDVRRA